MQDATLDTWSRLGWLTLAGAMLGLAVVVAWGSLSAISDGAWPKNRRIWARSVWVLAVITVIVWIWQTVVIVTEWRSVGFVAVHLVLAALSIAVAVWAVMDIRRDTNSKPPASGV